MTRLLRAMTLTLAVALLLGPASAAFATDGAADDVGVTDRGAPGVAVRAGGPATDVGPGPAAPPPEADLDRDRDRIIDEEIVPERDRDRERDEDQVRRPECDPDATADPLRDCRPADTEIRPALARCIHYVQGETDQVITRSLRWWWRVCHRLAWNHNNPV